MNSKERLLISVKIIAAFLFVSNAFAQKILVNKAGYLPGYSKVVYFPQPTDSFFVRAETTNKIVFKEKVDLLKQNDLSTGLTIYRGDFSSMYEVGKYVIEDKHGNKSSSFSISDTVFNKVFTKALKQFYFQRCGTALLPQYAGIYQHEICHHQTDATYHSSTDTSGQTDAFGGWHDAGDYGKYVINAGITVGTLLMAYELYPDRFAMDNLNIPESGNGVPDILDECRYELDWLFKMQKPNGAVFAKLTREQFEGFVMPEKDKTTRYIYQVSSAATGDFVAMMARAYRVFKSFDDNYANKCLDVARKAWAYLESHPQIFPAGGFRNPPGTATGEYGDGDDSDERLWAAAELFESTGEEKFHNYYLNNYQKGGPFWWRMSWQNVRTMANLTYLFSTSSMINQSALNKHRSSLLNICNTFLQRTNNDGLNVSILNNEYNWGSNSDILNNAILLIAAYKIGGSINYFKAAQYQLNYILGANAHDLSFVTGVGDRYSMNIHHRPSGADNVAEPVPGMLAGGPNKNINQDPALQRTFNPSTPPALCYIDHQDSYASNENCINWNAPLVFVAGFFNGEGLKVGVKGDAYSLPLYAVLDQNYPNPFNPSTNIEFSLPKEGKYIIRVYNILGQVVATLENKNFEAGYHKIAFDGSSLSSGIYFYSLSGEELNSVKKMILMK